MLRAEGEQSLLWDEGGKDHIGMKRVLQMFALKRIVQW